VTSVRRGNRQRGAPCRQGGAGQRREKIGRSLGRREEEGERRGGGGLMRLGAIARVSCGERPQPNTNVVLTSSLLVISVLFVPIGPPVFFSSMAPPPRGPPPPCQSTSTLSPHSFATSTGGKRCGPDNASRGCTARMLARICPPIRLLSAAHHAARRFSAAGPSTLCPGCGCILQSNHAAVPGFVPPAAAACAGSSCVCERCFRIRNYGARHKSSKSADARPGSAAADGAAAVTAFLSSVRRGGAPVRVLLVVDPFDFTRGMWQQALRSAPALKHAPVDICVTKMDLLPPAADVEKVMVSILETTRSDHNDNSNENNCNNSSKTDNGNDSNTNSIFAVSSTTQNGIKKVVEHVHHVLSCGVSVLLVGFANAGKSSLANAVAGKLRRILLPVDAAAHDGAPPACSEAAEFTVSKLPGTTLHVVPAPLFGYQGVEGALAAAAELYDSPGLISELTFSTLGARLYKDRLLADSICFSRKKKLQSLCVKSGQYLVIGRFCSIKV
jgi:hypothetical protein